MICPLDNDEILVLAKARLDTPFKLLRTWLFGFDNVAEDFEYLLNIEEDQWFVMPIKILWAISIYLIVALYKIIELAFKVEDADFLERCFEFTSCLLILTVFGTIRLPYAMYTYMRFSRAKALIFMLKSD